MKKQVDFQIASYIVDEEARHMREEVKDMQAKGWEVQAPLSIGIRKEENGRDVDIVLVPMIKYEEVKEKKPAKKKAGRPKKEVAKE